MSEDIPNGYHSVLWAQDFVKLLYNFPTWTSIFAQNSKDSYPGCVTQFSHIMGSKEPLDVPNFFIHYMEKLEPILDMGKGLKPLDSSHKITGDNDYQNTSHFSLNYQENWMNKNKATEEREPETDLENSVQDSRMNFSESNISKLDSSQNSTFSTQDVRPALEEKEASSDANLQKDKNKGLTKQKGYIIPYPALNTIHEQAMDRKHCSRASNL